MRGEPNVGCIRKAGVGALLLATVPIGSNPPLPETVLPCVPCHGQGYRNQVAEWRASPYSESEGGSGCTTCHGTTCTGNRGRGVRVSPDPPRWQNAMRLSVIAHCHGSDVVAEVAIANVGAGHLLPTGSAERPLMLEVASHDRKGNSGRVHSAPVHPPLKPFETVVSRHRFSVPGPGPTRVTARLIVMRSGEPPAEITSVETICDFQE
jgi:hypothetical protein